MNQHSELLDIQQHGAIAEITLNRAAKRNALNDPLVRAIRDCFENLPEGVKMVMPGDNITMNIELIAPVALEEQMRFAIREGGKTVGAGVVTKILV